MFGQNKMATQCRHLCLVLYQKTAKKSICFDARKIPTIRRGLPNKQ